MPVIARLRAGIAGGLLALCAGVAGAAPPALDTRLAALELAARSQPAVAVVQLGALLQALPEADPQRVLALAMRGTLQVQRADFEGAEATLRQLDALQSRAASAASAAGLVRAALTARQGPLRRADRIASEALTRLPGDALPSLRHRLIGQLAMIKEDSGQLDEAVRLRQQMIQAADENGPPWRRADARIGLANTLLLAAQPERARLMHDEAVALAIAHGDLLSQARALTIESTLLGNAGDSAGELRALTRAIELSRHAGSRGDEVLGLANLADHYLKAGDFATALRLSQQALPLSRALADPTSESVALANIGLSLLSMRKREEGLDFMRQAMAIDERAGALTNMAALEEEMAGYLERAGYLRDAMQAYQRHRKLADEVFRRGQQQAILELQEGFDNERRLRELELLQRENRLTQTELINSELQQRIWVAAAAVGALLLALAAVLLQRLRRHRHALTEGNALLQTQSERDPLTGLANRRHLLRAMQSDGSNAVAPFEGSLLLIDLDHFKQVNDARGHAAGDAVLVEVAKRLRATLRDEDLVVRWGGEEFLVVGREMTQDQVQALAQRLLTAIGTEPVPLADGAVTITASIGFACFPTEPTRLAVRWERALDLVDTALYLAKAHGRNLAYGVRLLHARDESELLQISRGLEEAWSDGRVKLTPLRGPAQSASDIATEPSA